MADRNRDHGATPPSATEGRGAAGDSARICLGVITGAHGIKGRVRVKSFTADPDSIAAYGPLSDESGARRFALELTGAQKGVLIASIEGVDDRNAAEALRGLRLYIDRAALPEPEEDEFYETDLIGLTATREDGSIFGTIRAVNDFGAGASLEVEDRTGQTLLVPFTNAAVPLVDIANKRVVIVPPTVLESSSRESDDAATDKRDEV